MNDGFTSATSRTRPRIEIIFEFSVSKPKIVFYRGVQATDGSFRMERRGVAAKKFKACMWTGSVDGLYRHRDTVEHWHGPLNTNVVSQSTETK